MEEGVCKKTCVEMHLMAASCLYVSGFWGFRPQTLTGTPPMDPAGGLPSPTMPTLTLELGYTTDRHFSVQWSRILHFIGKCERENANLLDFPT